jgi:hypothetical protein
MISRAFWSPSFAWSRLGAGFRILKSNMNLLRTGPVITSISVKINVNSVVYKSCLKQERNHLGKVEMEQYRNARSIHTFEWFLKFLCVVLEEDLLQTAARTTYLDAWTMESGLTIRSFTCKYWDQNWSLQSRRSASSVYRLYTIYKRD